MKRLRIPTMFLAAVLQFVPLCRTVCTSLATDSAFAIIFRWAVGGTAALGAFDAVSGATNVTVECPTNVTAAVGSRFTFYIPLSGSGVKNDPGAIVAAVPLPAGLTNYTYDGYQDNPLNIYGVITGIASNTASNFHLFVTTTHPSDTTGVTKDLYLTVLASAVSPSISSQPTNVTVTAGSNATFSVTASGTAPLTYQWYKGNTNISSRVTLITTNNTYTTAAAGTYIARVFSPGGNIDSSPATLSVNSPPAITSNLANITTNAGNNVVFKVTATGSTPLTYRWFLNTNTLISGPVGNSYTITSAQGSNSGIYSVIITNAYGSITSSYATLTVNVPPAVSAAPTNLTVTAGQPAAFNVTATGTAPLSYQWRRGGAPIAGATGTNYTIANARWSDNAAAFTVVITNVAGSITSSPAATLTVNSPPPPVVGGAPVLQGGSFLFTFTPVVGLTNTVLTNSAAAGAWNPLTNLPPPATASSITVTDTVAGPARFYRVQIVP